MTKSQEVFDALTAEISSACCDVCHFLDGGRLEESPHLYRPEEGDDDVDDVFRKGMETCLRCGVTWTMFKPGNAIGNFYAWPNGSTCFPGQPMPKSHDEFVSFIRSNPAYADAPILKAREED